MDEGWEGLKFWSSPAWAGIQEKLDGLDKRGVRYNPDRSNMFKSLDLTPFDSVKVAIIGQDPYPQRKFCTGVAFSIPVGETTWPSTLVSIMKEYCNDLGTVGHDHVTSYPLPKNGDLTKWAEQGVLLWNATPTYQPFSIDGAVIGNVHYSWDWNQLTEEIISKLSSKPQGMVFALLGGQAREFVNCIDDTSNYVIETSHPSPRGAHARPRRPSNWVPFAGSRLFSTINDRLVQLKHKPIDWRL
jgi:uracil-DNA glycosylase